MMLSTIGSIVAVVPANALTFNFTSGSGITNQQLIGFQEAGSLWSAGYDDLVTVNITINFTSLGANSLGEATSFGRFFNYSDVYTALNTDKKSADDNIAVGSLSTNGTYRKLTNYSNDNPNGAGSITPYLSTNNNSIVMTNANAKALGLIAANDASLDATITLNSDVSWSYGIPLASGTYDFVGVAIHEIGHVLGFNSSVDTLNDSGGTKDANEYSLFPLDLFRYSDDSKAENPLDLPNLNTVDFTVGVTEKYFSIDGGKTEIASLEKGTLNGSYQAQHWLETSNALGIMDPATDINELKLFTINDVRAFDVIGWDRSAVSFAAFEPPTAVPEPENYVGTLICALLGVGALAKRRQKSIESARKSATKI